MRAVEQERCMDPLRVRPHCCFCFYCVVVCVGVSCCVGELLWGVHARSGAGALHGPTQDECVCASWVVVVVVVACLWVY
jgi:hypothetical protein